MGTIEQWLSAHTCVVQYSLFTCAFFVLSGAEIELSSGMLSLIFILISLCVCLLEQCFEAHMQKQNQDPVIERTAPFSAFPASYIPILKPIN